LFEGSIINHDDPQRVMQRLATYRMLEKEILDFYKIKGIILEIDAQGSIEDIFGRISEGLGIER
jgi:adenylate kinase family enzyme